ncbi:phosphocholine cytidylyltransferase family protein [candidate division WOR-3 bacterium]|nr:phosphocholine cytidylyltransferase family protein [candidate division WOR-3 bacterium]
MQTIILAAGEGRRLHPLTLDRPKAMLEVEGRTLIGRAIDSLHAAGITDEEIILLSGHKAEKLKVAVPNCRFINNEVFASTNNIYSLWLARELLEGKDFILLNSDVLFAAGLTRDILEDRRKSVLMVDDVNPLKEEEMRVITDPDGRITAISKTLHVKQSAGEYIGLARFGKDFSKALFAQIDRMMDEGQTGVWYENAIDAILDSCPLYSLSTGGLPWIEIDTHEDLARAAEVAREIEKMET